MGLQGIERGLERMVEGVFSRAFRSSLRPIELGRRLVREMDDHRSVDVKGRTIVPNDFSFGLSPQDHATMPWSGNCATPRGSMPGTRITRSWARCRWS